MSADGSRPADPGPEALAGWVAAWRRGEAEAFQHIHAYYGRVVHAILLARVPAGEADDLVQDVFLRAWRSLRSLADDRAFGGWLCTIARNRAVDFHRRRRRVEVLPDDLGREAPPTAEAREALAAIRQLPDAYRETLLMRLVGGLTGPEIAERTGLTPGSVRVNLHRGMKQLRERLQAGE
ncbi:MAG: sigma-70 family RNA polymerase sigma factor [Planctomycetota bacterium]|nr:sigma-70 family RNA polymerase sigma factor [Planctomycetota bacterium]